MVGSDRVAWDEVDWGGRSRIGWHVMRWIGAGWAVPGQDVDRKWKGRGGMGSVE